MVATLQNNTLRPHRLRAFLGDTSGNISLLFGLSLLPLMAATGSAIDYSRASDARTQLQIALDSTALAMAKRSATLSLAQLTSESETYFRAIYKERHGFIPAPLTVTRDSKALRVESNGPLQTTFMQLMGQTVVDIAARADAGLSQKKVELVLALDNTGSMSRLSKMDELKKATRNLLNAAEAVAPMGSGLMKVALIPFDTQVRVEASTYRSQPWLAFQDDPAASSSALADIRPQMKTRAAWNGCIGDRNLGYDANDRPASLGTPESLHPAVGCGTGSLAKVQPLTDNWSALRGVADTMRPSGCTNITIGARFGLAALSPTGPIAGGVPFGTADVDKYLVILTDGDNTQNRFKDACNVPGSNTEIDARTTSICNEIKAKSSRRDGRGNPIPDVKVFTVRVMEGNRALLESCATGRAYYKEVNDASQIDAVFKDIIREITALRLTM